tara:strand:- start:3894 stop:4181 length:288 start_codon:yes stop_codon:yes gene_type:complete
MIRNEELQINPKYKIGDICIITKVYADDTIVEQLIKIYKITHNKYHILYHYSYGINKKYDDIIEEYAIRHLTETENDLLLKNDIHKLPNDLCFNI